jgi:hypothetical protein
MNEWPNSPEAFRQLYAEHRGEYEALRARPGWSRSAAEDDRMRVLFQKLALMEKNPWVRTAA